MADSSIAYIALGSNLDNPLEHLQNALDDIASLATTQLLQTSKLYKTKPIGPDQPDIINAVIQIQTDLTPLALLHALQAIELAHGRERIIRFGARSLDLDVLLFDDLQMDDPELIIPHPRMQDRNFVLIPLHDIAPDLHLAPFGHIKDLIANNNPEDYVIPLELETFGNHTKPNT